jgi:hypothetical protein
MLAGSGVRSPLHHLSTVRAGLFPETPINPAKPMYEKLLDIRYS